MTRIVQRVTVKRSEWMRGLDEGYLLDSNGRGKCCLGFWAEQCLGATPEMLTDAVVPADIRYELTPEGQAAYNAVKHTLFDAATPNDVSKLTDEEREAQIIEIGRDAGVEFTFID